MNEQQKNWNRKEETVGVGEMRELEIQRKNKRIKWATAKEREEKSDGEEKREKYFGRCENRTYHPGGSVTFQAFNVFN